MSEPEHYRDHWLQRGVSMFLQALILGLAVWIGSSVESLRETSALNTYKISQIQAAMSPLPVISQQIQKMQFQIDDLESRQSRDDIYRAEHPGRQRGGE